MQRSDLDGFRSRLEAVAETFARPLSPAVVAVYFGALEDLPTEDVFRALQDACRHSRFMPKPAEVRALVVGDSEDATEAAWMMLRAAMRRVGSYASLVVDDAALGEAIVSVFQSWSHACGLELSEEMWAAKRKEFGRVYRVLCQRGMSGSRYLTGICEQQNAGRADWMNFVPVSRLTGERIRSLNTQQAEEARMELATSASALASRHATGFERLVEKDGGV